MTSTPNNITTSLLLPRAKKTGDQREMTLKIKLLADLAGHSLQLPLLNTLPALKPIKKLTLLNKSLLIAPLLRLDIRTMDAMEVGTTGLGTTLLIKEVSTNRKTINTPLLTELATPTMKDTFPLRRDMWT